MSTSTSADAIAARYGNDGRAWLDANGVELEELLVSMGAPCEWRDGRGTDVRRYTLADGSAVLLAGDCWDVGYSDCWCSATAIAHNERCTIATTTTLPPTRECDECGKRIREGYGTDDGGVSCSLACAGLTRAEYDQIQDEYDNGDGPEPFVYWTEWEETDTATEPSLWPSYTGPSGWWEESDLPEAAVESVTLDGWEVEETGGGMRVLSRLYGKYWAWMSDADDGGRLPEVGSPALVGFYSPDDMGEPLAYATFPTAAECAAWAEGYAARVVSADV